MGSDASASYVPYHSDVGPVVNHFFTTLAHSAERKEAKITIIYLDRS